MAGLPEHSSSNKNTHGLKLNIGSCASFSQSQKLDCRRGPFVIGVAGGTASGKVCSVAQSRYVICLVITLCYLSCYYAMLFVIHIFGLDTLDTLLKRGTLVCVMLRLLWYI